MNTTRRWIEWGLERVGATQLERLLRSTLEGQRVCLCLHRVAAQRRAGELEPKLTIHPETLDAVIEALLLARPAGRWLTVSFDDGYLDSAEYLLSRHARFPQVDWLFFVCPEKTERRVGFRWDLAERWIAAGEEVDLDAMLDAPHPDENARPELRALAARPEYELASVELCRTLQQLSNVRIGNHTNRHLRLSRLPPGGSDQECAASFADFDRLFGRATHFAFPFGVPGEDFDHRHVESVRRFAPVTIWSTEPRPYFAGEALSGAVLPRYAVEGTRTWKQTLGWIALSAMRARVAGPRWVEGREAAR